MEKLWFRAKNEGWGWYPASWQGWSATLLFVALMAHAVARFTNYVVMHQGESFVSLLLPILLHTLWASAILGAFLYLCVKFGERPTWV